MIFRINTRDLSQIFWPRLLADSAWDIDQVVFAVREAGMARGTYQQQHNSIPLATAVWLHLLTRHVAPMTVFEVGTYIGRSTAAIALAMTGGVLHTCDKEPVPDIAPFKDYKPDMRTYPGQASTDVLKKIQGTVDLFFFDGRLPASDLELIHSRCHEGTVIAFDDFEGFEKGVANAGSLTRNHVLVTPPPPDLLLPYGVGDRSTLALLLPASSIRLSHQ